MISQLVEKIIQANEAYRLGNPLISDSQYDILIDELRQLDPNNELLTKVGHTISDESRKSKLPIEMASMNKIKSMEDIDDWCRLKGIPKSEYVIITPKFDGLSLCVNERTDESFTRGDGEYGQKSNEHYKLIGNHLFSKHRDLFRSFDFTYGEVMMSKKTFNEKYSTEFANPRNLVAGLLNSKEATESLKDCSYIKYGAVFNEETYYDAFLPQSQAIYCAEVFTENCWIGKKPLSTKQDLIEALNACQEIKVEYHICQISELTEELLIDLFHKFSVDYEIDGLIIEINRLSLQNELGRETSSNNPCYARAFKHPSFEQSAETEVIGISWNISKQGYLKPIIHINPVKLDGVTVSNVTGNNARFVKDMGIGVGAKVLVKRSGMVIPIIAEVIEPVDFAMPDVPNIDWNENGVELMTLTETDEQKFKQLVSFFEILETDNFGEGVIKQLWDVGYKSVKDILDLNPRDLEKIDRFGARKSVIVYNSIQKAIKGVSLSKLQHATGIFKSMGSKKLALLEHFKSKPTIEEVLKIEGIGEILAKEYVDKYDVFFEFIKELPITIEESKESLITSGELSGKVFIFTGVRRPDLVKIIESKGGKEGSSVSKNTTYLVCADKSSVSSKMKKAMEIGVKVIDVQDLENILK